MGYFGNNAADNNAFLCKMMTRPLARNARRRAARGARASGTCALGRFVKRWPKSA